LSETATANIAVDVYDGATLLAQTGANENGSWSFQTGRQPPGEHTFLAVAMDVGGVASQLSAAISMTIDTHIPAAPVITSVTVGDANALTAVGTSEANDKISVYDGTSLLGRTVADAEGVWSFIAEPSLLALMIFPPLPPTWRAKRAYLQRIRR